MLKKTISSIGLAAFVAVLLAGAANTASAAFTSEKAFNRDGSIKTTAEQVLEGDFTSIEPSVAKAIYFAPGIVIADPLINDENLVDEVPGDPITYAALFDIFVYDIDNTGGTDPALFKNDLASIAMNAGVPAASVDFGVANLRFTWYAGAFEVLTSTTFASDLDFSLAADPTFFAASNRLPGCVAGPCAAPGAGIATRKITDADGVLDNSTVFFNFISDGFATLLVTGSIIEPGGGGYVSIITVEPTEEPIPEPIPEPDHFKCYDVELQEGVDGRLDVLLEDQFESKDTTVGLRHVVTLCNPVDKNREGITNPDSHLVCYQIRDVPEQAPFEQRDVLIENQFGGQVLTATRTRMLCVPSSKMELSGPPTPS